MELNGNTFIITNKKYNHANIAQWGTKSRDMGTYEQKVYLDQFWQLKEDSNNKGFYYIHNIKNEGYRIAKWGTGNKDCGIYNGQYFQDQMWKFVPQDGGYYRIYNYKYPKAKITKFGKGDDDWGTYTGADYDDQLWKLTPRYKAEMAEEILFEADNRAGSRPYKQKTTVTMGLKLTSSNSLTSKVGLEVALAFAVSGVGVSAEMTARVTSEISEYMSSSEEKSWSKTEETTFSAPAGKNYRVKQTVFRFSSPLGEDNLDLRSKYTIEETDGEFKN